MSAGWVVAALLAGFLAGLGMTIEAVTQIDKARVERGWMSVGDHVYRLEVVQP